MNDPSPRFSEAAADAARPLLLRILLVAAVAAYLGLFVCYPSFLPQVGVNYFGVWFLDSFAVLASNDAAARGLDVYATNPLDYLQRPHVYSHWWLELRHLGLTRAHNFAAGITLVLTFLGVALAALRPVTVKELLWYLAILCSSPVLLAVHRANNDLVIFILLAPLVPCLLRPTFFARVLAAVLVALAAALKFYPAAAFLLLLAGNDRSLVKRGLLVGGLLLGLAVISVLPDLARWRALLPYVKAEGLMTFGAGNWLRALGVADPHVAVVALIASAAIALGFFRWSPLDKWKTAPNGEEAWLRFVLGAVLLTSCFFSGVNFAYRWIFAIWMAPFLWRASHDAALPQRVRRFAVITGMLLFVALWADPFAALLLTHLPTGGPTRELWANRFFVVEQPLTWIFFGCLTGWVVHYCRSELRSFGTRIRS